MKLNKFSSQLSAIAVVIVSSATLPALAAPGAMNPCLGANCTPMTLALNGQKKMTEAPVNHPVLIRLEVDYNSKKPCTKNVAVQHRSKSQQY